MQPLLNFDTTWVTNVPFSELQDWPKCCATITDKNRVIDRPNSQTHNIFVGEQNGVLYGRSVTALVGFNLRPARAQVWLLRQIQSVYYHCTLFGDLWLILPGGLWITLTVVRKNTWTCCHTNTSTYTQASCVEAKKHKAYLTWLVDLSLKAAASVLLLFICKCICVSSCRLQLFSSSVQKAEYSFAAYCICLVKLLFCSVI